MSMHFSRNVVVPVWFAVFALFASVAPPLTLFVSVLLITAGLAVPAIALVLWHDPPLPVAAVPQSVSAIRKSPLKSQN